MNMLTIIVTPGREIKYETHRRKASTALEDWMEETGISGIYTKNSERIIGTSLLCKNGDLDLCSIWNVA